MKRAALYTALLLAGAGSASAQSSNLYTSGSIQYDYLTSSGSDASFAYADFALGFGFGGGSSLPMGFDLGVLGFAIDGGGPTSSEIAFYPTFWVDTSVGRFSVGVPRSAIGSAIHLPRFGGGQYLSLMLSASINQTDYAPLMSSLNSYGLRYDGTLGGFDTGLSVHRFNGASSDVTTITGFVGRDYGAFDFAVGFEAVNSTSSRQAYVAQVGYDVGRYGGHVTLAGASTASDLVVMLDGFYKPLDWLSLNASYASEGGTDDIYGVNAEASFLKNGYVGIGYVNGFGGGSDGITTAYVGWKLNY